jgi:acyl carrier protein
MELLDIINIVLENKGRAILLTVKPNDDLRNDLGLDSLDLAELTVRIESEFDIDIFENGLVKTVGEIQDKLGK